MQPSHLRRHAQRGTYDLDAIKAVFEDCFIAHVSYVDNGLPACMPMVALIREQAADDDGIVRSHGRAADGFDGSKRRAVVYLHGHPSTRLMELVREASRESEANAAPNGQDEAYIDGSGTLEDKTMPTRPVRVCITATKIDGLVLSSAPNGHTFNYRSAVIHGTCKPTTSKELKRKVMHDVTNHIVANRWEEVNPVSSFQVSLVYVVHVDIDSMSVKSRTGVPGVQPRNREVDGPDIDPKPWMGVIPLWEQLGGPVEVESAPGVAVSETLRRYIRERNERHRKYAENVAR